MVLFFLTACGNQVIEKTIIEPCYTFPYEEVDGYILQCGDMEPVIIYNGKDGLDGEAGEDGVSPKGLELVVPCPETAVPSSYPETLLCLNDETLFAVYDSGKKGEVRLSLLLEGQAYQTTDGRNCRFTVEEACKLSY